MINLFTPGQQKAGLFSENVNRYHLQLGYYDLLSKNSELYNPRIAVSKDAVVMKLTSPDDNQLQITLLMTLIKTTPQGVLYSYKAVSSPDKNSDLLIANTLGYLEHQNIRFNTLRYPEGKVTVASSGLIITHN
ncbi:hypothetical protein ACFFJN_02195 [Erwinia mallotivora]|uniref:hypothetical protein n=1 Tax=Erwinia mallotivora TaxID=69222 RepID=UPI0035E9C2F2